MVLISTIWLYIGALIEKDRASTIANAVQNLSNLTRLAQEHAERTFRSADQALRLVKARYEDIGDQLDLKKMVLQGAIDSAIFNQVGIIDAHGIYQLSSLALTPGLDLSDREHFKVHLAADEDQLFISKPVLGRASGKWSIQLSRRINGPDGTFGGVAVISLTPYYFTHFYGELDLGAHGITVMYGLDGVIRARKMNHQEAFGIPYLASDTLALLAQGQQQGAYTRLSRTDGIERLFYFRRLQPYPLAVTLGLACDEVLLLHRATRQALLLQAWLASALILITGAVFSLYQYRMRRDMLLRQHTAEQLTASQLRITLALDGADQGMWEWHLASGSFLPDVRMGRLLGYASLEALPPYATLVHPDDLAQVKAVLTAHLKRQTHSVDIAYRWRHRQRRWIWLLMRGKVIEHDSHQRAMRVAGTVLDVTTRIQAEQQLSELNAQLTQRASEAEQANLAKSAFLANMSHELRTPMNAVIGFTHVLEQAALPADALALVHQIGRAGRSLLGIINDVLDFSKIDAGHIALEERPFCLHDVLEHVSGIMAATARQKNLELRIAPPDASLHPRHSRLWGDALRLEQVLLNLVSNGIKFTDRGQVQLDVTLQAATAQHSTLRFAVRDSGIGIAPERQNAIFDSFTQEDDSITRRFGGTGLGLAISARLVALMGGELGVTSVPGSGSEFWFALRLPHAPETPAPAPGPGALPAGAAPPQRLDGMRILVVDDSDINREVAQRIFAGAGALVTLANDGQQALHWLQTHPDAVDLVLMDVQMPLMDGYQATRQIRRDSALAGLPVIALSAGAFINEQDLARQAGMNGFIPKPFDVDAAIEVILTLSGRPAQSSPAFALTTDTTAEPDLPGLALGHALTLWKDAHVYRQYLRRFVRDYAGIAEAMARADQAGAGALAHKLKGVAGSLALHDVAALAAQASVVLGARADPAEILLRLQHALETALGSIAQYAPPDSALAPVALAMPAQPGTPSSTHLSMPLSMPLSTPLSTPLTTGLANELATRLADLLTALHSDRPGPARPILSDLAKVLPATQLAPLQMALENFDFRGAEAATHALADALCIALAQA